jgi:hypothetical protein
MDRLFLATIMILIESGYFEYVWIMSLLVWAQIYITIRRIGKWFRKITQWISNKLK